jgi:hypothetical protein
MNKELKFNEEVFGFKQERDPNQRHFISDRSYQTGTILVPYKGTIVGIRNMLNGDVFYTIEAKEINIFERNLPINNWEHLRQIEISSTDIFFSENDLKKGIIKKVDEFRDWAKIQLDKINLNKTS